MWLCAASSPWSSTASCARGRHHPVTTIKAVAWRSSEGASVLRPTPRPDVTLFTTYESSTGCSARWSTACCPRRSCYVLDADGAPGTVIT
ncbi:MAG: hypothetical protein ACLTMP_02195 [Eggerthella lenta]